MDTYLGRSLVHLNNFRAGPFPLEIRLKVGCLSFDLRRFPWLPHQHSLPPQQRATPLLQWYMSAAMCTCEWVSVCVCVCSTHLGHYMHCHEKAGDADTSPHETDANQEGEDVLLSISHIHLWILMFEALDIKINVLHCQEYVSQVFKMGTKSNRIWY